MGKNYFSQCGAFVLGTSVQTGARSHAPPVRAPGPSEARFQGSGAGRPGEAPHAGPGPLLPHLRFLGTGLRTARMQRGEEARPPKICAPHIRKRRRTPSWES